MSRWTKSLSHLSLVVAVCCLPGGGPTGFGAFAQRANDALNPCEQAGVAAEREGGLPDGLLLAIGRVESGRWDPVRGRMTPWPWTINAAGKGQFFEMKDMAAQTVKALLDGGTRSIDVGCFQISLLYHPTAFNSLEQAFDPDANARYATRFLLSLFGRTGSWEAAVEAYHSADPTLGFEYRQQVFSTWTSGAQIAAMMPVRRGAMPVLSAAPAKPVTMPMVFAGVQVWSPMPVGMGASIVTMPPPSTQDPSLVMAPLPVVTYKVMPRR
jgi:hypothetical protein